MPLDNLNNPRCINHEETLMIKSEARSAITNLEKNGNNYTFIPDKGIPIRVFVCPTCGYVEMYLER
jgi:hypothetical protein